MLPTAFERRELLEQLLYNPDLEVVSVRYEITKPQTTLSRMKKNVEWRRTRDSSSQRSCHLKRFPKMFKTKTHKYNYSYFVSFTEMVINKYPLHGISTLGEEIISYESKKTESFYLKGRFPSKSKWRAVENIVRRELDIQIYRASFDDFKVPPGNKFEWSKGN